jgi:hypothetical protein
VLRRILLAALFAISAALLAAPAAHAQYGDDGGGEGEGGGEQAPEQAPADEGAGAGGEEVVLEATLTGAEEVPGPGDEDGTGTAKVWLNGGQVRFELSWENIQTPATLGHIHSGAAGEAGPPVVTFFDAEPALEGTVEADPAVVQRIIDNPAGYYVNIHTEEFPDGAVRGQLAAAAGAGDGGAGEGEDALPFTGPSSPYLLMIGLTIVLAGALLLVGSRKWGPAAGKHLAKHMAGGRSGRH